MNKFRLTIDGTTFRDPAGREVTLRGINVAGDSKLPMKPDVPSHVSKGFFEGDSVSFVGRPFPADEAHVHFERLRRWGYNTLRYLFTWEAIEHAGPRQYDEAWIQQTIDILRKAKDYGFYIFLDPHQDVVRGSLFSKWYSTRKLKMICLSTVVEVFGGIWRPYVDVVCLWIGSPQFCRYRSRPCP